MSVDVCVTMMMVGNLTHVLLLKTSITNCSINSNKVLLMPRLQKLNLNLFACYNNKCTKIRASDSFFCSIQYDSCWNLIGSTI